MPRATINGISINYERHGDVGEPLVFVHGWTGDVTDWRHQIAEFAPGHRVLAMDLRGHGGSDAPSDRSSYTIMRMADDVEALIAHAGFERYHLVGHSMGGATVQEIALRSPQRLLSLTIEDSGFDFGVGRIDVVVKFMEGRNRLAEEQGMQAVLEMTAKMPSSPRTTAERREEENQRMGRMSVDGLIGGWEALMGWAGTEDRLAGLSVPLLLIYGELDAMVAKQMARMAELIPGAALEVVPDAGHSPQFERPEVFNRALRAHLARN
jgi:2-succinyl-6-hydroxy-2,4-cyclohexadiene-1-carboxylate synthase